MNIFVGNLSRDVTEDDLLSAFGAYGKVDRVSILKDKFSGEPRGFGFVEMPTKAEAQAASTSTKPIQRSRAQRQRSPSQDRAAWRGRRSWRLRRSRGGGRHAVVEAVAGALGKPVSRL